MSHFRYDNSEIYLRRLDAFASEPGKHIAGNIIVQAGSTTAAKDKINYHPTGGARDVVATKVVTLERATAKHNGFYRVFFKERTRW